MLPFSSGNDHDDDGVNRINSPVQHDSEDTAFQLSDDQAWHRFASGSMLLQQPSNLAYYPPPASDLYLSEPTLNNVYQTPPTTTLTAPSQQPQQPQHHINATHAFSQLFAPWQYQGPAWHESMSSFSLNLVLDPNNATLVNDQSTQALPLQSSVPAEKSADNVRQEEQTVLDSLVTMARKREKGSASSPSTPIPGPSNSSLRFPTSSASNERHYKLVIVQEPIRARMCGFGDKDRRPVSPPPILQLFVTTANGEPIDPEHVDTSFLVVLCDTWQVDGKTEANIVSQPPDRNARNRDGKGKVTRNLIGSLAASATKLHDPGGKLGIFFIFQDLSLRLEGSYRLGFSLTDISFMHHENAPNLKPSRVLATVQTQVITVYSAKKFPGVVSSTELSKCFTKQGVKIPIRRDTAKSRKKDKQKDSDSDSQDSE